LQPEAERERTLPRHGAQNEAGLYVVSTPIGNARDIALRALDVLRICDLIAAEDTRVTSRLLAIHGISRPLTPYNDHNAGRERPRLLARLRAGECIALVSDAGTPLISDPGYKLVREALSNGLPVHAIPGPSAVLTALTLAGLPTNRFFFAGFLPNKPGDRRRVLTELRNIPATLVLFESAQRLSATLAEMRDLLGSRPAAIARELTKLHEELRRGDLPSLAQRYSQEPPPKGEVTIVVGPPAEAAPDFKKAERLLACALPHMPLRAAAGLVADALNLSRRAVYERALSWKASHESH
jgi:16S rRNA (cytidine1402-2'-O)-methyltransferase